MGIETNLLTDAEIKEIKRIKELCFTEKNNDYDVVQPEETEKPEIFNIANYKKLREETSDKRRMKNLVDPYVVVYQQINIPDNNFSTTDYLSDLEDQIDDH